MMTIEYKGKKYDCRIRYDSVIFCYSCREIVRPNWPIFRTKLIPEIAGQDILECIIENFGNWRDYIIAQFEERDALNERDNQYNEKVRVFLK